jgi:pyruvate dehydrogenase E1 component alpha subunit
MKQRGLLDDEREVALRAEADRRVAEAVNAFEALEPPSPDEIFAHVYEEITPPLAEQLAGLRRRIEGRG